MKDPVFLTLEQVEILHRLGLQQHGGQEGLRDRAAFESATLHPQNAWFYGGEGSLVKVVHRCPTVSPHDLILPG